MLFSQTLFLVGAFLTTSAQGLAVETRDNHPMKGMSPEAPKGGEFKFCYEIDVTLSKEESYKLSAQEKTKHIKEAFDMAQKGKTKDCGKETINTGYNPASGSVLKAFVVRQTPTRQECHAKDKQGKCGIPMSWTLSERDPKNCGTCKLV
ncbi:hypothetical protein E2P81_ATG06151 [Venturia nashicola]|uniref:Uncharacterized protein n=1 Tax=Venturia nashicola TaxID=86259 RepID=A0A4Z1P2P7_9PEZI|nr:hypothetical protein E6O75_ATG06291 [Venturia nashicola]TLD27805.1 hypothetical protein E2P81_ATG06151 [Venturia nashicola]